MYSFRLANSEENVKAEDSSPEPQLTAARRTNCRKKEKKINKRKA